MSWSRDINTGDIPCIILAGDILQSAGQLDKQISKLGKEIVARGGSACMRACVRAGGRLSYYICFICFVAFYLFDCDLLLLLLLITSFSFYLWFIVFSTSVFSFCMFLFSNVWCDVYFNSCAVSNGIYFMCLYYLICMIYYVWCGVCKYSFHFKCSSFVNFPSFSYM